MVGIHAMNLLKEAGCLLFILLGALAGVRCPAGDGAGGVLGRLDHLIRLGLHESKGTTNGQASTKYNH